MVNKTWMAQTELKNAKCYQNIQLTCHHTTKANHNSGPHGRQIVVFVLIWLCFTLIMIANDCANVSLEKMNL